MEMKITALHEVDLAGKKVLFRPDINSPIDPVTKRIVNENRLSKNAVTLKYMLEKGAAVAIIAHQGDTQDYQNLIPMSEHAEKLSQLSGFPVRYIDDVCGPAALQEVRALRPGEAILLGNLRYLGEELSTFSNFVKLTPEQMQNVWHVRTLAPLFDLYVNDAFSAAHRNAPSMVGFPAVLPSAAGFQFVEGYKALSSVLNGAEQPSIFVLGGAKISDAFGMMETVLQNGTADRILTTGVIGVYQVGFAAEWIAREYLGRHGGAHIKMKHLTPARCPLLGYAMKDLSIDGQCIRQTFLRPETQSRLGEDGYDQGAKILVDFFKETLQQYLTEELDPLGREIIECCLRDGSLEDYCKLIPMDL